MDHDTFLAALDRDSRAFAEAARAGWDAEVPACPGWRMPDLVWHLGEVHNFWRTIAGDRMTDWKGYVEPERPSDGELLAWYETGVDTLVSTLRDADPDTEVFTWAPQKDIAFIVRRMAQETAVHRWDAEDAAGRSYAIEPALAADGIDEFLTFFLPNADKDAPPVAGTVHVHCTD
ncbi:MAG: maleylpyruvate isomerase family mycothiol-dependent enzyme, partial [Chloroflexi bacterium]|nr:maleylpyruvate isomerase family mycothiol-dependent enzyme [Chloroflexota bacterium]